MIDYVTTLLIDKTAHTIAVFDYTTANNIKMIAIEYTNSDGADDIVGMDYEKYHFSHVSTTEEGFEIHLRIDNLMFILIPIDGELTIVEQDEVAIC